MLLQYRINFEWCPGCRMTTCDALGCRPVYASWHSLPDPLECLQEYAPLQHSILNITGLEPFICVEVSDNIKATIRVDTNYQEILKAVGMITRKDISHLPSGHPAKELTSIWGPVSKAKTGEDEDTVEVILVDSSRLYIPAAERRAMLDILHHPHQGVNRTLAHARRLFYWGA